MLYCGWDVTTKGSYYYITDKEGNKIANGEVPTDKNGLRTRLTAHIKEGMTIAIEAGNQVVGKTSSQTLLAAVDDVKRFSNSKKLVSYSGLAPSVQSSGDRAEYGAITREGHSEVRGVWCQIAHLVAHSDKPEVAPLRVWFARVSKRRGKRTATVALTRKLLTIAYRLLRDNVVYDPQRLSFSAANT